MDNITNFLIKDEQGFTAQLLKGVQVMVNVSQVQTGISD